MDVNEKILGDGFIIYDWKETADKIDIYVKSTVHVDTCPVCVQRIEDLHNTYH